MLDNAAPEEILWVVLGFVALVYMLPALHASRRRWRQAWRDGRNGRTRILLRGDMVIGSILLAIQMLLTIPGLISLSRPSPPLTSARLVSIGFLMVAQGLVTYLAWYRSRMYVRFYAYDERTPPAKLQQLHDETLGKIEETRNEARAAHIYARQTLERIDEATRDKEGC